jgi:hypothetical protein
MVALDEGAYLATSQFSVNAIKSTATGFAFLVNKVL